MICWRDFKIYDAIFVFYYKDICLLILICLMFALIELVYDHACFSFHICAATANLSISAFFIFLKCSFTLVSQSFFNQFRGDVWSAC